MTGPGEIKSEAGGDEEEPVSGERAPQSSAHTPPLKPRHLGSFSLILIALFTGIGAGLVFGEYCAALGVIGDAYVGLLQMTVLPYIVFSLISNIGRLSFSESKRLAVTASAVLALLWIIGAVAVFFVPFTLPDWETGSFFSTSLISESAHVDFLSLFIPSNPFRSLANNFAPAVVVFCILFGVALMGISEKEDVLRYFDVINAALSRVSHFVMRLSPIGIFAISASAAGTLTLEEFGRLQAYLYIFVGSASLLTFGVLPMLIASLTPFKYGDILRVSRNALVTGFVVGSVFVIIPLLIESIKDLLEKIQSDDGGAQSGRTFANPGFIIPLAYPFPHLGKILTLLFVPFAGWFYGNTLSLDEYPLLISSGLFLSFGKVTTTIPFLLDLQQIPSDIFELFLLSSVVAGRFSDLMGAMHLLTFTVLTTCAMGGLITLNRLKLVTTLALSLVIALVFIVGGRHVIDATFKEGFSKKEILGRMHLLELKVPASVLNRAQPHDAPLLAGQSMLQRIDESGIIRVGFNPDNLPFSYFNANGNLVGLDVDMAHRLAHDLGVSIEFVPFSFRNLEAQLAEDHFDIAMSGVAATIERAQTLVLSDPYMSMTMAFVVRDHERDRFNSLDSIRRGQSPKIGVQVNGYFAETIGEYLPDAHLVALWSESQFFEGPPQYMDAMVTSAEGGSAWTLLYPNFSVVNPLNRELSVPVVYPLGMRDLQMERFLGQWIELKQRDGTIQKLYDYWILGRSFRARGPRWSVVRNVFGWVD